jgi:hypothetical protein
MLADFSIDAIDVLIGAGIILAVVLIFHFARR